MKKTFIPLAFGLLVLLEGACSKSETTPPPSSSYSLEGKWVGTYNNGAGGPVNYFALTFKSGGAVVVHANNSLTPDVANGTWVQVADTIKATYSYTGSSAIYAMAAIYSSSSNVMTGTVGLSPVVTGEAVFSVTKQQ